MGKDEELTERIVKVEESAKSAHKRIDSYEKTIDNIHSIALDVKCLAGDVRVFAEQLVSVKNKSDKIEKIVEEDRNRPNNLVYNVKEKVITGVFMIIIAALLAVIIKN